MILKPEQIDEMMKAAIPLIKWINDNCHPHCRVIADQSDVELVESMAHDMTLEFIKD